MNYNEITLSQLKKWTDIPKVVSELHDETWFVAIGDHPVGVGLFKNDKCIMAILGDDEENQKLIGHSSNDSHADELLIQDALKLAFVTYLRSIKGDRI